MAGNRNSGRRRKPVLQHKLDGTYRHDRHGADEPVVQFETKPAGTITASARSQRRWVRSEADEHALRNGCRYNEALAEHVFKFFAKYLRFSKGQYRGKPFELNAWQRDELIGPLFGWVRKDGFRRFRRSYVEVPKKNYKSTTASGIGLYMLLGDEEGGAEIYSAGADKDQARIVHGEAIHMVEASDDLMELLNINRTTGNISYGRTQSFYRAVSAAPTGKHGFNIHCAIIDELHEWRGNSLWDSLRYGYRARQQPLEFVITNAGDDIQSVCYQQHTKARSIIDGKLYDDSFFALILSVEEEAAAKEIDAVIAGGADLTVAKSCNPGLGDIITEVDLLTDVNDVGATPSGRQNFLRLTYGVWATAVNPWLDVQQWAACKDDFSDEDLAGEVCYGGLDLSKTKDMTSLVLCFPDGDDQFKLLPFFWLPEDVTTDPRNPNRDLYQQWKQDGFLRTLPGSAVDYRMLTVDLVKIFGEYDCRSFCFDQWSAESLTQQVEEETGVEREVFPQTITNYTGPTTEFERLIINEDLRHDGHPILTWQAGHVTVKTDPNGNKRPVKPPSHDHRKIDGIVAAIMALSCALQKREDETSIYETREPIYIE